MLMQNTNTLLSGLVEARKVLPVKRATTNLQVQTSGIREGEGGGLEGGKGIGGWGWWRMSVVACNTSKSRFTAFSDQTVYISVTCTVGQNPNV